MNVEKQTPAALVGPRGYGRTRRPEERTETMALALRSANVNPVWEARPYQLSDEERWGLEELLDCHSQFGVARRVSSLFGAGGTMPTFVGHGAAFDLDHVLRHVSGLSGMAGTRDSMPGGGKSHALSQMYASTVGEIVERILGCLTTLEHQERWRFGSYRELTKAGCRCIGPAELHLHAPEQFEAPDMVWDPFTEDSCLAWTSGKRLFSKEEVWLPAQVVYLYYLRRADEAMIGYGTSGGLSTHISEQEALYHGITELFERDAMNLSWHSRIPPAIVEIDRPLRSVELERILHVADSLPGRPRFYLHAMDTPELVKVTAIELDGWLRKFAYSSGAGVDFDAESAMLSSFNECGQGERVMRQLLVAPGWQLSQALSRAYDFPPDVPLRRLNTFFKAIPYYGYEQNRTKLDWYLNGGQRVALTSLPELSDGSIGNRWRLLTEVLRRKQWDPVVFDFTPSGMRHLRLMKAFIPELTLAMPPAAPMLGHPRYYEMPRMLGLTDRRLAFDELNSDPMPYP